MMASSCIAVSKPRLLKDCFLDKLIKVSKPLCRFYSSANKPPNEEDADQKAPISTHKSQDGIFDNGTSRIPEEYDLNSDKIDLDRETYYKVIESFCRDRRVEDAKRILFNMSDKGLDCDEDLFLLLIHGYAKNNRKWDIVKNCVNIFLKMEELGVPRTIKSYNSLLEVIISEKKYAIAEKFFDRMLSEGVIPTQHTYTFMISGFCRSPRVETANRLFADMKNRNLLPDFVVYNSLINGYVRVKKMEEAEKLLKEMKGRQMEPSLVTYNSMIKGYVKVRKMEDAEHLVVEMKARGIEPNLITYNTLINGYVLVQKIDDAHKLAVEMKGRNVEPNLVTYSTVIKGYVAVNKIDEALGLLEEMKRKRFGSKVNFNSCLAQLKEDCYAEIMSETQRNVLQEVEDHIQRLELLAMRDAARELSELANQQVVDRQRKTEMNRVGREDREIWR